jgi:WD40 repeat protein
MSAMIRFAPDGKSVVVSITNIVRKIVKLQRRDFVTGKIKWSQSLPVTSETMGPVRVLDFSDDGQLIATGGWPNYVLNAEITQTFYSEKRQGAKYKNSANSISFSPNDDLVPTAYPDGPISFWDITIPRRSGLIEDAKKLFSERFPGTSSQR